MAKKLTPKNLTTEQKEGLKKIAASDRFNVEKRKLDREIELLMQHSADNKEKYLHGKQKYSLAKLNNIVDRIVKIRETMQTLSNG